MSVIAMAVLGFSFPKGAPGVLITPENFSPRAVSFFGITGGCEAFGR